jgi:hypothetical protein
MLEKARTKLFLVLQPNMLTQVKLSQQANKEMLMEWAQQAKYTKQRQVHFHDL